MNATDVEKVSDNTDEKKNIAAKRIVKFLDLLDATLGLRILLGM